MEILIVQIAMRTMHLPNKLAEKENRDRNSNLAVIIVYDDMAAARRAARLISFAGGEQGENLLFQSLLWRFDLLADSEWAKIAAAEASKADLLIISTSSQFPLPSAVRDWLTLWLSGKRGTEAAVVALFGADSCPDKPDSPRLQFVQSAAKEAGLDFFAPSAVRKRAPTNDPPQTGNLTDVTGILEEIGSVCRQSEVVLTQSPQSLSQVAGYRHWGINE